MVTSGKTKVYGLIGCPVEHSVSPMMQNLYAEHTKKDLTYVPFRVEEGQVEAAIRGAFALHIQGLNVTVPHKQAVMPYLESVDEAAAVIGAVNTLVRTEQGYKGYNTDAAGMRRAMKRAGIQIAGKTCILLGAGGAAKAAAYMLATEGAGKVYVLNRSLERAETLARELNGSLQKEVLVPMALTDWQQISEEHCLAVQTTSVGMHPNIADAVITDAAFYQKLDTAFDAIYTPLETRFLRLAREAGATVCNGLDMLIYQGVIAYELWNPDVTVTEEAVCEARDRMLRRLGGKTE